MSETSPTRKQKKDKSFSPPKGIAFRNKSRKNMKPLTLMDSYSKTSGIPPRHPWLSIEKEVDDAVYSILELYGNKGKMSIDVVAFKSIELVNELFEKDNITREELHGIIENSKPIEGKLFFKNLKNVILGMEYLINSKEMNK